MGKRRTRRAFVWGILLAEMILAGPLAAEDVIYAATIADGGRGVVFQVASSTFSTIYDVTGAGDVDRDGFSDFLCTVNDTCSTVQSRQLAILVYGRPDFFGAHRLDCTFPRSAHFRANTEFRYGGESVFSAGDLDRDGFADFFFTYPSHPEGEANRGRAFLVFGGKGIEGEHFAEEVGSTVRGIVFYSSEPTDDAVGNTVANIGDFDGDGREDLAFGCPFSDPQERQSAGRVYIVLRVLDLPRMVDLAQVGMSIPGVRLDGVLFKTQPESPVEYSGEHLGYTLSGVGDVDHDGFADVAIHGRTSDRGRQYLLHGTSAPRSFIDIADLANGEAFEGVTIIWGLSEIPDVFAISAVGDMNGDGLSDILLAHPAPYRPLWGAESAVHLLYGAATWPSEFDLLNPPPDSTTKYIEYELGSGFGGALAPAGDLNGDGIPDFLVGAASAAAGGNTQAGEAYAIFGRRERGGEVKLAQGFAGIRILGEAPLSRLGGIVASAGDFNGDGALDIMTTARRVPQTGGDGEWSRIYLLYGNGGKPDPLRLLAVDPGWGPMRGETVVELRGTGFRGQPIVSFGGLPAKSVQVISESKLRATTPAAPVVGFMDVTVTSEGVTRSLLDGFEYTQNFPEIAPGKMGTDGLVLEGVRADNLGSRKKVTFGDLTGDGMDELVVAPSYGTGIRVGIIKGAVDLPGRLGAFRPSPRVTVVTGIEDPSGAKREAAVSVLGDVNGDGLRDLAVTRTEFLGYILFGSRDLPAEIDLDAAVAEGNAVLIFPNRSPTGSFTIVPMGDLTGDGIEDLAIGFSEELSDQGGQVKLDGEILFMRGRADWPEEVDLGDSRNVFARLSGSRSGGGMARNLVPAGDVNGDGIQDLLADVGQGSGDILSEPYVYVIYGSDKLPVDMDVESYLAAGGGVRIRPPHWNFSFAGAGDVNGDGYADIAMGIAGGGMLYQGVAYLIFGGPELSGQVTVEERPAEPDGIVRFFGAATYRYTGAVGPAGDFDADGHADFLIGEIGFIDTTGRAGNVFLILGRKQFPERIELARIGGRGIEIESRSPQWGIGPDVGPFGDMNGDGKSDFAIREIYRPVREDDVPPDESYLDVIYGPTGSNRFIRGDANEDTTVDISDAVSILSHLFLGGAAPCDRRPLDVDDNGALEVTDAVYLLGFLFQGQDAPQLPFPSLGIDPTPDGLGCRF